MKYYTAFGLTIASTRPLPGLGEPGGAARADVVLHTETDPWSQEESDDAHRVGVFAGSMREDPPVVVSWYPGRAMYRFQYSDGTEFWIARSGAEIWARWPAHYVVEDMMTYFQGPILGFVLRLRGVTSLHGSAVVVGDRAVVFAGPGGSGKSTTAAAFALQGYGILADDVSAVEDMGTEFRIQPAYPHLRLWGCSVEMLYGLADALTPITPNWDKFDCPIDESGLRFQKNPLPLGAIYLLGERTAGPRALSIEVPGKREAMMTLTANTYVNYALTPEMRTSEFDLMGRLLRSVPVRRVIPHADPGRIQDLCDLIVEDVAKAHTLAGPSSAQV